MRGCSGGAGHAWLLQGVCMVALRGHAWLLRGGMHGCSRGACVVAPGGCMVAPGGGVFALGGHVWLLWGGMCGCSGGRAWYYLGGCMVLFRGACMVLFGGGMRGFFSFLGYNEIRSMSILLECILVHFKFKIYVLKL